MFENVAFGLRRKKVARAELARRVEEMLELVELGGLGKRKPRQLSGGDWGAGSALNLILLVLSVAFSLIAYRLGRLTRIQT